MITSNNCENSSNRKLEEGRATFAAFSFSTAVKSLKRESVDGIISKDVNASLSTLFEKKSARCYFYNAVLLSTPCGYQRHHVLCYSTVIG